MNISRKLITWCAVLVIVFVQAPHLANEFARMSALPNEALQISHGILFAIAIDASVLIFAVQGRVWQTALFMVASLVITLQYYKEYIFSENWLVASVAVMISAIGVLAVFFLSMEAGKSDSDFGPKKAQWQIDRENFLQKIQEQKELIKDMTTQSEGLKEKIEEDDKFTEKISKERDSLRDHMQVLIDSYSRAVSFEPFEVDILKLKAKHKNATSKELIQKMEEDDSPLWSSEIGEKEIDDTIKKFRSLYTEEKNENS